MLGLLSEKGACDGDEVGIMGRYEGK